MATGGKRLENLEVEDTFAEDVVASQVINLLSSMKNGDNLSGDAESVKIDLRGLLSENSDRDPLGESRSRSDTELPLSYINTVCLPQPEQFTTERCWLASWGTDPLLTGR